MWWDILAQVAGLLPAWAGVAVTDHLLTIGAPMCVAPTAIAYPCPL